MASVLTNNEHPFSDIRDTCKNNSPQSRIQSLQSRLIEPVSRRAFKEWAQSNDEFVKHSHFMRWINGYIEKVEQKQAFCHSIQCSNQLVMRLLHHEYGSLIPYVGNEDSMEHIILNHPEDLRDYFTSSQSFAKEFPLLLGYFKLGAIDQELFLEILIDQIQICGIAPSALMHILTIPVAEALAETHPHIMIKLFASKNQNGVPNLFDPIFFKTVVTVLEKLVDSSPIELERLIKKNNDGTSLLDDAVIFEQSLPILIKLIRSNSDILNNLLGDLDERGNSFLHYTRHFEVAIVLFEELADVFPAMLKNLLGILNKYGHSVLHYANNFEKLVPLLKKLAITNPELLHELLSTKNKHGASPFHSVSNFEKAIPFFEFLAETNLTIATMVLSLKDAKESSVVRSILEKQPDLFSKLMKRNEKTFLPLIVSLASHGDHTAIEYLMTDCADRPEVKLFFSPSELRSQVESQSDDLLSQLITLPAGIKMEELILNDETPKPVIEALNDAYDFIGLSSNEELKLANEVDLHNAFMKISCLCIASAADAIPDILIKLSKYMTPSQQACLVPFFSEEDFLIFINQPFLSGNIKLILQMTSLDQMNALLDQYFNKISLLKKTITEQPNTLTSQQIATYRLTLNNDKFKLSNWVNFFINMNNPKPINLERLKIKIATIETEYAVAVARLNEIEINAEEPSDEDLTDVLTQDNINQLSVIYGGPGDCTLWIDRSTLMSIQGNGNSHPYTRAKLETIRDPITKEVIGAQSDETFTPPGVYREYTRREGKLIKTL